MSPEVLAALAASGGGAGEPAAEGVSFDGVSDYLSGQSFSGSNLSFDVYYVSGTMPFGLAPTAKYTWIHIDVTGSYTVENIGLNFKGRLANLKLDSVVDMPMRNADTAHINEGTGGDFTPNGVLDTARRGPNQYNCAASTFDGVNDWIVSNGQAAFSSSAMTISFTFKPETLSRWVLSNSSEFTGTEMNLHIAGDVIRIRNSSGTVVFEFTAGFTTKKQTAVSLSFDLADTNKKHLFIDGVDRTSDLSIYNAVGSISYGTNWLVVGRNNYSASDYLDGAIGELWIDDTYVNLSSDNIFYDADQSRSIPVDEIIEGSGQPRIALKVSADNPNNNLGYDAGTSMIGGPLIGARGMSEYIARGAVVDGTNYLTGSVFCQSLVKWKSVDGGATWTPTYANSVTVTNIGNGTDNGVVAYYFGTSENINWALEENKNRFTDQLGFPKDMDQVLADNPSAVLAMDFSDSVNFGLNKAGSDFTEVGTVTAGADVKA